MNYIWEYSEVGKEYGWNCRLCDRPLYHGELISHPIFGLICMGCYYRRLERIKRERENGKIAASERLSE